MIYTPLRSEFYSESSGHSNSFSQVGYLTTSVFSTLTLVYFLVNNNNNNNAKAKGETRSTILPGFGLFGDRVNEFVEIFLDSLAIYVHHDKKWDCQRKLLCEANQRASSYGAIHGILIYFSSLFVSFWLRDQRVSESMEAMRKGRQGQDCSTNYPMCPFSL